MENKYPPNLSYIQVTLYISEYAYIRAVESTCITFNAHIYTSYFQNMKYFEKFLADNESGYDDIDISVHCDVEIFEWLMNYIHNKVGEEGRTAVVNLAGNIPNSPNKSATLHIDKSILISILISSEFLQMDSLVVPSLNDSCCMHNIFESSAVQLLSQPLSLILRPLLLLLPHHCFYK